MTIHKVATLTTTKLVRGVLNIMHSQAMCLLLPNIIFTKFGPNFFMILTHAKDFAGGNIKFQIAKFL
jgi:hypothetical protein